MDRVGERLLEDLVADRAGRGSGDVDAEDPVAVACDVASR
jgi:hypothetical protein